MKITTIGTDLAKEAFQIHRVDVYGKVVLRQQLRRSEVAKFSANLEPSCPVGMKACSSPHKALGYVNFSQNAVHFLKEV